MYVCVCGSLSFTPPHQEIVWNTFLTNQHQMAAVTERGQLRDQQAMSARIERDQPQAMKVESFLEMKLQCGSGAEGV